MMAGMSGDIETTQDIATADIPASVTGSPCFSADTDMDECFDTDEANIFSQVSMSYSMRNVRVPVRRKCLAGGWDALLCAADRTQSVIYGVIYGHYKIGETSRERKNYLISLRKFII